MKVIRFENLSDVLRELMDNAIMELERVQYARDDAAEAVAEADAASDWDACDKWEAEHRRLKYNIADLEALVNSLHDAANALEGLEDCGHDVLKNMGLV